MTFSNLVKQRYSVRKYDARPVEAEKLTAILEAGRLAPTAVNYQPQRILVVQGEDMEKMKSFVQQQFPDIADSVFNEKENCYIPETTKERE